jgi:muramidase (phage lysozyme)
MPRQDTPNLNKVNLAPAARQVNTFVQGRRSIKDNSASRLASALQGGSKILENIQEQDRKDNLEQVEVDIQRATDNKLAGGNLFSDTYRDNIADYEEIKGTLGTSEDAAKYFLEKNQKEFEDPHAQAGYDAKLKEKFSDFRATHNNFLVTEKIKDRNIALSKSFFNDVLEGKTDVAFANMKQAASNYGAKAPQTNALVLESVKAMLSQGRVDKAQEVLNFQRGPAKSLVENPETAEEAGRLMKRVADTREAIKDARFEDLKLENRVAEEQKITNDNKFFNEVMDNPELTNAQKILQLENENGAFKISDKVYTTLKRTLTARENSAGSTDNELYANILKKVSNLSATSGGASGTATADYLKGMRNIRVEAEEAIASGSIQGKDVDKIRNQIANLSNTKEAEALSKIARVFQGPATKFIDSNVAPENRGHVIKDVFFATEELRARQDDAKANGEKFNVKEEYLKITEDTVKKFKEDQILKAQEALSKFKDEDPVGAYMKENSITDADIRAKAREHNTTPERVREKMLEQLNPVQGSESQSELKGGMGHDAILEVIGLAESKGNYNLVYDGTGTGKEINLTSMSVGEVLKMQAQKRKDGATSTASGKYQFIHKTLKGLVNSKGIDKNAKFDEEMQDELAGYLLESRKKKATKNGKLDKDKFAKEIAKEWASMPKDSSGRGHYDGDGLNKALVPYSKVEEVLASL